MTDLTYGYARYPFFSPPIFKSLIGIRCVMWSLSLRIIFLGGPILAGVNLGAHVGFIFNSALLGNGPVLVPWTAA